VITSLLSQNYTLRANRPQKAVRVRVLSLTSVVGSDQLSSRQWPPRWPFGACLDRPLRRGSERHPTAIYPAAHAPHWLETPSMPVTSHHAEVDALRLAHLGK
jgi:hypothetical protein